MADVTASTELYDCNSTVHPSTCFLLQELKVIKGWLRVDSRPFKQALLTSIKKWSFLFKEHLTNHVTSRCVQLL